MGYSKKNMLEKAKAIQQLYKEHVWGNGATAEWTYKNIIYPRFFISRATFYKYLGINVASEMEVLNKEDNK